MKGSVHLITEEYPPSEGGLELWTERFAGWLSRAGMRVTVYVCGDQRQVRTNGAGYEVVPLAPLRFPWEEPLADQTSTERFARERARMNYQILKNEISRRAASADQRPLLISNFMLTAGHVAAMIGRELHFPHIAVMVGTDFSRGFRNAGERAAIAYVCRTAAALVVKNSEQRAGLESMEAGRIVCIPSAIELPQIAPRSAGGRAQVALIADTGFSFKKGTAVLLNSVERLLADGLPVRLDLFGDISLQEAGFWKRRADDLLAKHGANLVFAGKVPREDVRVALAAADVYCSATLGEGSSSGRIAAICAGVPLVTTRCGEMSEGVEGISHVRLADVADADGFLQQLRAMVNDILQSTLQVDYGFVAQWRERFAPAREMSSWLALIRETLAAG